MRRSLPFDQDGLRDISVMSEQSERERSPSLFRNADADGNIPFVGQTGCSVTQFSKKPRTRDLQRRKLLKKFKDQVDERMEELSAQIRPERWIVTIPSSDQWLATIENHRKTIVSNGCQTTKPLKNHWYQWFSDQKPLENHCYQWFWRPKTIVKPLTSMVAFQPFI